jgi:hypothetical protein
MQPAVPAEVIRGTVPHPAQPGTMVAFFADWERACRHLGDHVLTAPECAAWALVLPAMAEHLDLHDANARNSYHQEAQASRGMSAQGLFDHYRQATARAVSEAYVLTWHASAGSTTAALGTAGVLVLIEGACVVTVYLPGQGSAAAVRESCEAAPTRLGRERGLMRRRLDGHPRDNRPREQREARWSAEERLYYRVFRPAVQFLRERYHQSYGLDGMRRFDGALLKRVLPPMSRLRLPDWQEYRAQVCAGGPS